MSSEKEPQIPTRLMPRREDVNYDLEAALTAVVSVRASIPEDAFTASVLGTQREGHGVVISHAGLILTIGYLIAEAEQVWILDRGGRAIQGDVVAYDYETGFGLVQTLGKLGITPLELGSVHALDFDREVIFAGFGGPRHAMRAQVAAIREFAGYWEYVIDEALFTTPPHPNWGGAAVLDPEGRLCAIGSLYIDNISSRGESAGNMSVPIDLFKPIQDELLRYGRRRKAARPWLGTFVTQIGESLVVAGLYQNAPAAAVLNAGDTVIAVAGQSVSDLATMFRSVWACGDAGAAIPLTIERDNRLLQVRINSVDRSTFWRKPSLH
jgi:S1-C subfamily serine protease